MFHGSRDMVSVTCGRLTIIFGCQSVTGRASFGEYFLTCGCHCAEAICRWLGASSNVWLSRDDPIVVVVIGQQLQVILKSLALALSDSRRACRGFLPAEVL